MDGGGDEDEDGEERRDKLSAKARQISQRCQRLSCSQLIHPAWLLHSLSVWPRPTCMTPDHSSSPRPFITPVTPILPLPAPRPPRSPAACHSPYRRSRLTGRSCVVKSQSGKKELRGSKKKTELLSVRLHSNQRGAVGGGEGIWSGGT